MGKKKHSKVHKILLTTLHTDNNKGELLNPRRLMYDSLLVCFNTHPRSNPNSFNIKGGVFVIIQRISFSFCFLIFFVSEIKFV